MNEHTVKSYEEELALLDKKIAQMGGLPNSCWARRWTRSSAAIRSSPRTAVASDA